MSKYESSSIRNIALVGHRSSGKTALAEGMLFLTGSTSRLGSVDAGTSALDFVPEEIDRKLSISPALAFAEHGATKINIIDTPGYAEFFAEVVPCLWVADTAVLVLDVVAGIEVMSRKVYSSAVGRQLPLIAVVTKLDKEHSSFDKVLASLSDTLPGCKAVAVQLPIGAESGFRGVIDLLTMKAYIGKGKDAVASAIPADMADDAKAARDTLMEEVAGSDEALMAKFFESDTLSDQDILAGLKAAICKGALVPVLAVASIEMIGVTAFLDFVAAAVPAPTDRPAWVGHAPGAEAEIEIACHASGQIVAVCFKTMRDPFVGRLSLIRVLSGEMRRDSAIINARTGQRERLSGLMLIRGKDTIDCESVGAGDMACVGKLEATLTGDTLCESRNSVMLDLPGLPDGMHTASMAAESRADEDKLSGALTQIAEEDIGFTYERAVETGELVVRGYGPLHIQIIKEQLLRKFKVAVALGEPHVPYRETARKSVRVQGRHKKQTGGRGQFGDVWIRLEPLERGSGFQFVNGVSGGSVPTNFIQAVEKGIGDVLGSGPLAHSTIVDVKVTLDDGSSHPVDSSDLAFRLAGQIAMRKAILDANPVLLEPVVTADITCPDEIMGDVMSDLSGRRGRVAGTEPAGGGMVTVKALVPLSEMMTYSSDLTSMSQGRASYSMEISHYEEVPAHVQEAVVAKRKVADEESE